MKFLISYWEKKDSVKFCQCPHSVHELLIHSVTQLIWVAVTVKFKSDWLLLLFKYIVYLTSQIGEMGGLRSWGNYIRGFTWGNYIRGFTFVGEFHSLGKYSCGGFSLVWELPLWGNNISGGISFVGDFVLSGISRNNRKKHWNFSNTWTDENIFRIGVLFSHKAHSQSKRNTNFSALHVIELTKCWKHFLLSLSFDVNVWQVQSMTHVQLSPIIT